jgi:hypothetical protein
MLTSLEPNLVAPSAAPHHLARAANVSAPPRMARQFQVAAPLGQFGSWPGLVLIHFELSAAG